MSIQPTYGRPYQRQLPSEYGYSQRPPPPEYQRTSPNQVTKYEVADQNRTRGIAIAALVLLFVVAFALAFIWYFLSYNNQVTVSSVVENVENIGNNINAEFVSLNVKENTQLGSNTSDKVNVNASIESNLIPDGNNTRNLGGSNNHWNNLYIDDIKFSNSVNILSDNINLVRVDNGFSYQKYLSSILLTGTTSNTLSVTESGFLYILSPGSSYLYGLNLPAATTVGTSKGVPYYDFVLSDGIGDTTNSFFLNTSAQAKFKGTVNIHSPSTSDGPDVVASFSTADSKTFMITGEYPVGLSGGTPGILPGSTFHVVQTDIGSWSIYGDLVVESGLSVGKIYSPFTNL